MNNLIEIAAEHVSQLYDKKLKADMHFHNLKHTKQTVDAVIEICEQSNIPKKEQEILMIAAWFHDVGYIHTYKNHEAKSAEMAAEFLKNNKYSEKNIETVKQLILKTELSTTPETLAEKILRDADLSHLAKKSRQISQCFTFCHK